MEDNIVAFYEKKCNDIMDTSDIDAFIQYQMACAPFLKEYYEIKENNVTDTNFPLVFKTNTKAKDLFTRYMCEIEGAIPEIGPKDTFLEFCEECQREKLHDTRLSVMVCPQCGLQTSFVGDELSYKEEQDIEKNIVYSYKRENHFNEWISQFQGTESTNISMEIIENIKFEFKKQKIKNLTDITHPKVRAILKKLRLNKYYEHVPYITTLLNGIDPPRMSQGLEAKLRLMFSEIQEPFERHCPNYRKNFLSYSYVLYKFCELLGKDEFLPCFPLLKSKDKLKQQDILWKKICGNLSWEYIATI